MATGSSIISESVPAQTRYSGTFLSMVQAPQGCLNPKQHPNLGVGTGSKTTSAITTQDVRGAYNQYVNHGFVDRRVFEYGDPGAHYQRMEVAKALRNIGEEQVVSAYSSGRTLVVSHNPFSQIPGLEFGIEPETLGGDDDGDLGPAPESQTENGGIFILHEYELSIYDGDFGYGKVLNTFSLLPGERTEISVRTFQHSETTREQAASILDNYSSEKASDFQTQLQNENTSSTQFGWGAEAYARVSGHDSWGFGSVSGAAGVSGHVNSQREQFAKNTMNVTANHAAKASAAREININTTSKTTTTNETEQQIVRVLENVNLSRTLNFTFSQMNRQFDLLLKLVNIRVAYLNDKPRQSRIVPLEELSSLLDDVVTAQTSPGGLSKDECMAIIWNNVWLSLNEFQDYQGNPIPIDPEGPQDGFIKLSPPATTPSPEPLTTTLKVNQAYASDYSPPNDPDRTIIAKGIIVAADQQVMRTDGVVVDAFVGNGSALDPYNTGLQHEELLEKSLENSRRTIANAIAQKGDPALAETYRQVFYGPPASLNMDVTSSTGGTPTSDTSPDSNDNNA